MQDSGINKTYQHLWFPHTVLLTKLQSKCHRTNFVFDIYFTGEYYELTIVVDHNKIAN